MDKEPMAPPKTIDPRDLNTPDSFVARDPQMVRLTGKHPFNAEAPLKLLEKGGYITPNHLHFVRNHGPVPQISWEDHRIKLTGLVNTPTTLTMNDITSMPPTTVPVTLVCAGNRRKEQNMVKQSIGFGWGAAGASTACWTGVYLRDVINQFGGGLKPDAMHICFEGVDNTSKGGYGTSVAASRVMSSDYDILLAYKMNGEFLPPDHGYPIRVVIPGCIGGRSVKWLGRIEASENVSTNPFHDHDNKVFPTQVQSAEQATDEGWWPRPTYTLYDLNINSVISTPDHGDLIRLDNLQDIYVARGYAYTGSGRRIIRVEVSLDSGKTWLLAQMNQPTAASVAARYGELRGPEYYKASRNWGWTLWEISIEVADLVRAEEMVVRAWDDAQNTQPENITWNLMGMMNNCWFRVKLCFVRNPSLAIYCEHPTLAGPEPGGWMDVKPNQDVVPSNSSALSIRADLPAYTMAEVELHSTEQDLWIVVHNLVYDCTPFLHDHPGGASSILITGGTDTTEEFDAIHSSKAQDMLQKYLIGRLEDSAASSEKGSTAPSSVATTVIDDHFLNPKQWRKMTLSKKKSLSPTIRLFVFTFDSRQTFGLPIGQHCYLKLPRKDGSVIIRAYTPSACGAGSVEFIIKIYDTGVFTPLLDAHVNIGDSVEVKGPLGEFEYLTNSRYAIMNRPPRIIDEIGMIAGGTGITPMWQVLDAMRYDARPPRVSLIYCARHREDLVLCEELLELQRQLGPDILQLRYASKTACTKHMCYSTNTL
ncbi:Oxidoreductase, molybdopterin-binding domain-containing protein [Dichotomocladium elegans]|nr:Oxidoreductase, molybdopterin-binding domain-containing protein [Dichotomocladium elegans]